MKTEQARYNTKGVSLLQLLFIVAVGAISYFQPALVSVLWLTLVVFAAYGFAKDRMEYVWYGVAMSPALEVWARMSTAPLLPYEVGKYFILYAIMLMLFHSMIRIGHRSLFRSGTYILLALLPGIIVNLAHFDTEQWVFNTLGIVELAFLLIFTSRERWHIERYSKTLQYGLASIIALIAYITIKTPSISRLDFSLKASASASGGFGSNQVATIIGMGILLTTILVLLRRPFFSVALFNYLLLAYLLFRGLLTFSRGGIVVALIAVFIVMLPKIFQSVSSFIKYMAVIMLLLLAGTYIFSVVNDMTGNMLLLRYQGETAGTYAGSKNKTLNTVLSGRQDIAASDIDIFKDHWLFGAGAGEAKKLRTHYGYDMDVAAHTEFTRLLSEQGIGGLVTIIILIAFPVYWVSKQKIGMWKGVAASLFVLGILTTFHAAMRTNTMIVCYALATIPILYERIITNAKKEL